MIDIPVYEIGEGFAIPMQLATKTIVAGVAVYTGEALTGYSQVLAFVYSRSNKRVLGRYAKNAFTDADGNVFNTTNFQTVSSSDGTFALNIQTAESILGLEDQYIVEIWAYKTDAQFPVTGKLIKFKQVMFALEPSNVTV